MKVDGLSRGSDAVTLTGVAMKPAHLCALPLATPKSRFRPRVFQARDIDERYENQAFRTEPRPDPWEGEQDWGRVKESIEGLCFANPAGIPGL